MDRWIIKDPATLISFLSQILGISKNKAKKIIDSRNVFVNNKTTWMANHLLKYNDIVEYAEEQKENSEINIIYEDDYIIAVNKTSGIITNNEPHSLESRLKKFKKNHEIRAVHRLDRDTTGVILFAKNNDIFERFKNIWQEQKVKKIYRAISHNEARFKKISIDIKIENKPALSIVELINKNNGFSYFKIELITGRKHQIRLHLASIRHPIVGDKEFGHKKIIDSNLKKITRQMLHSYQISYICPYTGKNISITAELPDDFKDLLKLLELIYEQSSKLT